MFNIQILSLNKDGFCGNFYEGDKHPHKAIIFMSGAGVSQKGTQESASFLVEQGYSVLVLGFYKWDGLPREMCGIPVEYVGKAISWLLSNPERRIEKIAIIGTSTGAGYSLLCASLYPEISCVIAISPFDHIMEGTDKKLIRTNKSVYTYNGKDISFTPLTILDTGKFTLLHQAAKNKKYTLRRAMRYMYDKNPPIPLSRIKVENMRADILMLAAKDDDLWPADEAVLRMNTVLAQANYPYKIKSVVYKQASHLLGFMPTLSPLKKAFIKLAIEAERKYPKECMLAREDSVQKILSFLAEW